MREYLIRVMGASLLSAMFCGLIPDGTEGKWVRFAAGIAVAVTVLSPVNGMIDKMLPKMELPEISLEQNPYLMDTFEKTLAEKTKQILWEQTGEHVQVTVYGETDQEGNVCGVRQVVLSPYSKALAGKTAEILGISEQEVAAE